MFCSVTSYAARWGHDTVKCKLCWVYVLGAVVTAHSIAWAKTAEEWRTRIVYQLLTDRFGPSGPAPSSSCTALRSYCGGTFSGIQERLDYITGLGANAIWISPFVENTEGGYHGYWAKDIYSVNPYMGTKQELLDLVAACHRRDVWVMMDVVANHMGPPSGSLYNFTDYVPFNETSHYHDYCVTHNVYNQTEVEICRLSNLPDLNQTVPFVHDRLLNWIRDVTEEYGFDGYRVDTATEVPKWFWKEFTASAGVFLMGEANLGDRTRYVQDTCYVADYQGDQALPSVLNFPLYWALRRAFNQQLPMTEITHSLDEQRKCFQDLSVLGSFIDNHDFNRFLNLTEDTALLSNALAYIIFGQGIPIIYYGTEQGYRGGADPNNRESLWPNYHTDSPLYTYISGLTTVRKTSGVDFTAQNQRVLFVDPQLLVFARGSHMQLMVAVTNIGKNGTVTRTVTGLPYINGTRLVNAENSSDVLEVEESSLTLHLDNGLPKVYRLQQNGANGSRNLYNILFTVCFLVCFASFAVTMNL